MNGSWKLKKVPTDKKVDKKWDNIFIDEKLWWEYGWHFSDRLVFRYIFSLTVFVTEMFYRRFVATGYFVNHCLLAIFWWVYVATCDILRLHKFSWRLQCQGTSWSVWILRKFIDFKQMTKCAYSFYNNNTNNLFLSYYLFRVCFKS